MRCWRGPGALTNIKWIDVDESQERIDRKTTMRFFGSSTTFSGLKDWELVATKSRTVVVKRSSMADYRAALAKLSSWSMTASLFGTGTVSIRAHA